MAVKNLDKWKAKKWFNIYTPEILGGGMIGEMPADDEKKVTGRVIKVNMSWITNKPEHSFMVVGLKVSDSSGNAAHTQFKYLEQTFSYLHSLVKRESSVLYTVNKTKDKNGKNIVLKLVVLTRSRMATKQRRALRKVIGDFALSYSAGKEGGEFLKDIIEGRFQHDAANKVKNIAESRIEIKRLEL